jgi:hypothetical protein
MVLPLHLAFLGDRGGGAAPVPREDAKIEFPEYCQQNPTKKRPLGTEQEETTPQRERE